MLDGLGVVLIVPTQLLTGVVLASCTDGLDTGYKSLLWKWKCIICGRRMFLIFYLPITITVSFSRKS